jgi:sigma-B regulation protein RsbU (phosphoserine phosphatase)
VKRGAFLTGDPARDQRIVDMLLGAVEELYGGEGVEALLRRAVDRAIQVTGAQRGILLLGEDRGLVVRVARDAGGKDLKTPLRYSSSVAQRVWTTGEPHLTVDADTGALSLGRSILDLRLLSILAAPLAGKGRSHGVLYVDSTATAKEFTEGDRAVFEALAGLVGVALERARLAAEEAERKRLAGELAVAQTIQRSLMPQDLAAPAGFDLAAEGRACVETSGDYYDLIPLEDGRLALAVGDVSGHGLGAALFMTCVRALLRTLLHTSKDPLSAFAGLNAFLCRDMPQESFMSLFVGVLDPSRSRLSWVSAGHNPPMWWRAGEPQAPPVPLERTGPVLGVLPDFAYRMHDAVALSPGDAIVFYTDGLTEARDAGGDLYGEERFEAAFAAHARSTDLAGGVLSRLLKDLEVHMAGRPMDDDVTCMVLRRLKAEGAAS